MVVIKVSYWIMFLCGYLFSGIVIFAVELSYFLSGLLDKRRVGHGK